MNLLELNKVSLGYKNNQQITGFDLEGQWFIETMASDGSSMQSISISDGDKALQMRRECNKMEATTPRSTSTFTVVAMVLVSNRTIFNLVVAKKYRMKKKGINILKLATKNKKQPLKYSLHPTNKEVQTFYETAKNKHNCNIIEVPYL